MVRMACCNALGVFSQTSVASLHLDNAQQAINGDRWETRGLAMTMEGGHALTPGDAARRMRTVPYISSFFVPYIPSFLWYPF